jgi:hypothetical protein
MRTADEGQSSILWFGVDRKRLNNMKYYKGHHTFGNELSSSLEGSEFLERLSCYCGLKNGSTTKEYIN